MAQILKNHKTLFANATANYISYLIFSCLLYLFYKYSPFYEKFIKPESYTVIKHLIYIYAVLGFPYFLLTKSGSIKENRLYILLSCFIQILKRAVHLIIRAEPWVFKEKEIFEKSEPLKLHPNFKVFLLGFIVKIFYLPIMLNFFFEHFFFLRDRIEHITISPSTYTRLSRTEFIFEVLYGFIYQSMFLIDCLFYSFGYTVELPFLKHKIKSVEPTVLGWAVALACYPPFNNITGEYLPLYRQGAPLFNSLFITYTLKLLILFLFFFYAWATVALGAKASNLTNRGIVSSGPYRIVRHPAYTAKNLAWWLEYLPYMNNPYTIISMIFWNTIYVLRALTEERHLAMDKDYIEYCKKVRYKFIPGLI